MPFQATANGAMVVTKQALAGVEFQNNLWFSKAGFTEADQLSLANMVLSQWFNILDNDLSEDLVYGPFVCYDMRTIDGPIVTGTDPAQGGESTADPLALSNAVCLTLRTNKRGRAHRGRVYVAGFTEAAMQDGEWTVILAGLVATLGDNLILEAQNIGWTFGVRSGQLDGVPRDPAIITPITSVEVRNRKPGIQRRRIQRP